MNNGVLNQDPKWMRIATESELREFVKILDENETHPRFRMLRDAYDKECDLRAAEYFEQKNGGEWI